MDLLLPRAVCISSDHSPSQNICVEPPLFNISFPNITSPQPPTPSDSTTPFDNSTKPFYNSTTLSDSTPFDISKTPFDTSTTSFDISTTPIDITPTPAVPADPTNLKVIISCSVIFGLLVIVVVLIILYFLRRGGFQCKKKTSESKEGMVSQEKKDGCMCLAYLMDLVRRGGAKADGQSVNSVPDFEQGKTSNGKPSTGELDKETQSTEL